MDMQYLKALDQAAITSFPCRAGLLLGHDYPQGQVPPMAAQRAGQEPICQRAIASPLMILILVSNPAVIHDPCAMLCDLSTLSAESTVP